MTKEELYQLTSKFLSQTLSAEEKARLEQWYRQGTDDEVIVNLSSESSYRNEIELRDNLLRQIRVAITTEDVQVAPVHRVHFLKTSWFRYAAAVVLIAGAATTVGVLTQRHGEIATTNGNKYLQADIVPGSNKAVLTVDNKMIDLAANKAGISVGNTITYTDGERISNAGQQLTLNTPKGGQYQAVLPDGSRVWLNAASSIKFPSKFEGNQREVEITGEVYLEVAKNAKQTFIVKANGTEVQVLGTSFNINAYTDELALKTTLVEGSVRVVKGNSKAILRPGEQCSVVDDRTSVTVNADVDQALAWKNGFFNFNNADLATVLRQLERWYDIEVKYAGKIPTRRFNGELPRSLKLSQVISALSELEIKFRIEGRVLIVMS